MTRYQGRQQKKKRKFEAAGALVLGRAQVRRPSTASRSLLRRLNGVLLLSLVAVAAGALWLTLDDRFYIYHADVTGTVQVSPDEVFRASGLPGLHVLWVRPAEIEARLRAALPTLESARVVCHLQPPSLSARPLAKCTIAVVERQPKVMWDEDGQLWWIDADGVIFSANASVREMLSDSWLVRGPLPRGEDGWLDERVRVALTELWAAGADVSLLLYYVPGRGLVLTDERGWRVVVGQGAGVGKRLQVLELLAADLEARGLTPRFVDVRFADAPYYSLTNDW
jgi:hypothetical protein